MANFRHGCSRALRQVLLPLLVSLFTLSPWHAWGNQAADTHGSLQLISEQRFIEPGHEFWIGLRFNLEKGWHIYWTNPGDSGEPPKVSWELPAGFRAGSLQWPTPQRLDHPPLTDFGYEGEVLLLAKISPPVRLAGGGGNATLAADVKWLVCRDICIPAHQRVTLSLPVKPVTEGVPKPDPNWRALFESMRARLPQPAPRSWKSIVVAFGKDFVLSIESEASQKGALQPQATFFPFEPLQIENAAAQHVSPTPRGIRLTLEKSDQLLKPLTNLKGVIVLGNGRAYLIDAPVFQNKRRISS
jgi:DsbC/DsbD-like thiol-disulfide interchange protein